MSQSWLETRDGGQLNAFDLFSAPALAEERQLADWPEILKNIMSEEKTITLKKNDLWKFATVVFFVLFLIALFMELNNCS